MYRTLKQRWFNFTNRIRSFWMHWSPAIKRTIAISAIILSTICILMIPVGVFIALLVIIALLTTAYINLFSDKK